MHQLNQAIRKAFRMLGFGIYRELSSGLSGR
jgi:hypothetical protein